MPSDDRPAWNNPKYVATAAGILAAGELIILAALIDSGLSAIEVIFVVLGVTLPAVVAYGATRRWVQ